MKIQFLFDMIDNPTKYPYIFKSHVDPVTKHFEQDDDVVFSTKVLPGYTTVSLAIKPCADIFYPHGISDKNWREAKSVNWHKNIFVSGPAWVDKLVGQGMDKSRIHIVGYPVLDPVYKTTVKVNPNMVLWAPTHTASLSSYPHLEPILRKACDDIGAELVVNTHPYCRDDSIPTLELIKQASVVIADTGSSICEAWLMGRPTVLPDFALMLSGRRMKVQDKYPGSFEAQIYDRQIGYHVYKENDLASVLKDAMNGGITPAEDSFLDDIFPRELRGESGVIAANAIRRIAE